jgi:Fur family ferric uptake transcriptional regulator
MRQAVTELRKHILEIIECSPTPLMAKSIHASLYSKPDISTVYRALDFFEKNNQLVKIRFFNLASCYYAIDKPHRHFLVCRQCNRIDRFDHCPARSIEKSIENKYEFEIHDHFLQFLGLCKECARKRKNP